MNAGDTDTAFLNYKENMQQLVLMQDNRKYSAVWM